jgi:hypothetical protein
MNQTTSSQAGLADSPLRTRVIAAALMLSAVALLYPVWGVHYPPLLDYPNHLASSYVISHLHDPAHNFAGEYSAEWGLKPYITTDFLMGFLGRIFPPLVGGKIVLTLAVLGLPLAAWFFLRQVNPGEDAIAFWFLLAGHNIFFRYGFIGFDCSLALLFLFLALWLRYLKQPSAARWIWACLALTATYFTHIMGFFFAGLIIGLYSLMRPKLGEWIRSGTLFLPSFLCYFISSRVVEKQVSGAGFRELDDKLDSFWLVMHGNSAIIDYISIGAIVALFVIGRAWNREFRVEWRWLAIATCMAGAFFALPVSYGDGYDIDIRALPVFFITLFATARFGRRGWKLVPLALVIFFARSYDVARYFHSVQPTLAGLAGSFTMTPPNVRVLPIVAGPDEDPICQYYAHFWAYGTIERGWFTPYLFQDPGLLPLNITLDTYTLDGFWDLSYNETMHWDEIRSDYDYVYAYDVPDYEQNLEDIGEIVYTSGKLKLFRIMREKPQPPAAPPAKNKMVGRQHALDGKKKPAAP